MPDIQNPKERVADPSPMDLEFLRETFQLALANRNLGKHPFAAVVVAASGEVVARAGNNSMPPDGDPTQHAELRAAGAASRLLSSADLAKATLYCNAEPCSMCAGAIYWCNIGRVVYGLAEENLLQMTGNHQENPTLALSCRKVFASGQHPVSVLGPLLEDEAKAAHIGFWR